MDVRDSSAGYNDVSDALCPTGYNLTEVGVIPADWAVKRFGDIGTFTKGKGLLKDEIKAYGCIPAIPYTALYTDFSEILNYEHIKWFVDDASRTFIIGEPCVLIASSSNMVENTGKACALIGTTPVAIGREVIIVRTESSPAFISYLLSTRPYRIKTLSLARGTTIKHVYPATFLQYKIACPSPLEQWAIVGALSDADALIESLQQLIAKKRQIKQGAMQSLLTGQQRLPGFISEWETRQLDSLADIRSGGTPSTNRPDFWGGEFRWCTPTDITALDGFKYLRETGRTITRKGLASSSAELIPANSIVMTSRATIGECAINQVPVCTNQGFKSFIPFDGCDLEFLYYLLQTKKQDFIGLCGGSTFLEIGKKQLAIFEVVLPQEKAEQIKIASILSDIDTEIAEFEVRLSKTRQLKQGMMQALLTGRIRLV